MFFVLAAACGGKQPVASQPEASGGSPAQTEQSFADAMRAFCDAPHDCPCKDEEAATRAQSLRAFIDERLSNAEARDWWGSVAHAGSAEDKVKSLEEALAKAQIAFADCPMGDVWKASADGPTSP